MYRRYAGLIAATEGGATMEPTEAFAENENFERCYLILATMAEGEVRRLVHLEVKSRAECARFDRMTVDVSATTLALCGARALTAQRFSERLEIHRSRIVTFGRLT
jgi:hypothetical protein